MNAPSLRADLLLFEQGRAPSREQARKLIESGGVMLANGTPVRKPSEKFPSDTVFICAEASPYVSRGAYKLLPALERHLPDLTGLTAFDIGASTGGFTDLMLQRGAAHVFAIDCGHGQLHPKLAADPRVVSLEKVNARHLEPSMFDTLGDVLTMDVSFISVTLIFPALPALLKPEAILFILVKPQFECGRERLGKNGVVKSEEVRMTCVERVKSEGECLLGRPCIDLLPSPIAGPEGNQEYIAVFGAGIHPKGI